MLKNPSALLAHHGNPENPSVTSARHSRESGNPENPSVGYADISPLQKGRKRERIVFSKNLLNFASNDYLGLSHHKDIINALKYGAEQYGVGGTSSALICGYKEAHKKVEQNIAEYLGFENAMLFSSGTLANYGLITTIADRKTEIFHDKYNHASLLDGTLLSRAKLTRFKHLDYTDLERLLKKSESQKKIIISESIFSMHGDLANINKLSELAEQYNAFLIIDDSHGFGIIDFAKNKIDGYVTTFGKAAGCNGAVVCGSNELIDKITNFGRQYIYTTAISPAICCAIDASINLIKNDKSLVEKLNRNIEYFEKPPGANAPSPFTKGGYFHIKTINIPDEHQCIEIKNKLLEKNILVGAIRPPTVPVGQSRLRINITSGHSFADIDLLCKALSRVIPAKAGI